MGNKVSLEEELINMRIVSKQMLRSSKKCEKNEKSAKEKLKKVRQHDTTRYNTIQHDGNDSYGDDFEWNTTMNLNMNL